MGDEKYSFDEVYWVIQIIGEERTIVGEKDSSYLNPIHVFKAGCYDTKTLINQSVRGGKTFYETAISLWKKDKNKKRLEESVIEIPSMTPKIIFKR